MLLALDIGFRSTGFVVFNPFSENILNFGVIVTDKQSGKRGSRLRVSDDDFIRCQRMTKELCAVIATARITGVVAEIPTGGARGARPNRCMGLSTGLLAGIVEALSIPTEVFTPGEIKKAATGQRNGSKEAVIAAMTKRFPALLKFERKSLMEHLADAAAVILAAEDGILYKSIQRSVGERVRRDTFRFNRQTGE